MLLDKSAFHLEQYTRGGRGTLPCVFVYRVVSAVMVGWVYPSVCTANEHSPDEALYAEFALAG